MDCISSDLNDAIYPAIPHINHSSPYTPVILSLTLAVFAASIPLVYFLPVHLVVLSLGLFPFFLTHPTTHSVLLPSVAQLIQPRLKGFRGRLARLIDNDRLQDKHWSSELREVELWENERWAGASTDSDGAPHDAGWSKLNLRPIERKAWTRGRDGWSGISDDGSGDVRSVCLDVSERAAN